MSEKKTSVLEEEFDNLMLDIFTQKEIQDLSVDELKERKMMFFAGCHVAITHAQAFKDPGERHKVVDIIAAETMSFIKKFNKENNQ